MTGSPVPSGGTASVRGGEERQVVGLVEPTTSAATG
jgi:hypothetical protein